MIDIKAGANSPVQETHSAISYETKFLAQHNFAKSEYSRFKLIDH